LVFKTLWKMTARQRTGQDAERRAEAHLKAQGLRLLARNYRVARGPNRRGGEIDLRARRDGRAGGSAASVTPAKQRSLVLAAQHYLLRHASPPPCRFDVVAIDGEHLQWLPAAFDAG
jgi:putative endonuclease